MNTLSPQVTVGEVAAAQPASIRVLEKHGIDFCCGGRLLLSDACATHGITPENLLAEIAQASAGTETERDWSSSAPAELIDHIVATHHAYLQSELPRLAAMLSKIQAKHSARHGAVLEPLAAVFGALKEELESHLMKEERVLFPLIRSLQEAKVQGVAAPDSHCGSVQNPLRVMCLEHDSAGEALQRIRALTGGYQAPEDACNTFRGFYWSLSELERDLHRHIHLENNLLFPQAIALEGSVKCS